MTIKEVTHIIETLAPLPYAEDFDNVGLLVGYPDTEVNNILVAHDALETVVDEAISTKSNLIISFHPIVFKGIKKFNGSNYVQRVVMKAIKHDIAIYAIHTALDNSNKHLESKIIKTLLHSHPYEEVAFEVTTLENTNQHIGMGMTGVLNVEMNETNFLNHVKTCLPTDCIRHSTLLNKPIKKIAVLGGSGSFAIANAKQSGAQAFITADLKYHDFYQAENDILLIDVGHYESEQFTKTILAEYLTKKIANFAPALAEGKIIISKQNTNPVKYF